MRNFRSELRIHAGLVVAEAICIPAFLFELSRAQAGNRLSWAYVFEWPILGGYAVYMWAKMLREERGLDARSTRRIRDAEHAAASAPDPQLDAWNAYLAEVHGQQRQAPPAESRDD